MLVVRVHYTNKMGSTLNIVVHMMLHNATSSQKLYRVPLRGRPLKDRFSYSKAVLKNSLDLSAPENDDVQIKLIIYLLWGLALKLVRLYSNLQVVQPNMKSPLCDKHPIYMKFTFSGLQLI